ncbi:MAG: aminomethyl-transferring glycine dehydrogenase subunit GcvPA [Candidatus Melainabacteria bacterium]|nr:aminomethyl-transferring glycine dehydrogenase subunit GcvPA [Candidatus Melainabacteria bacterium]MBI3309515.1 aminomethyl-transferring glycine dehydrogenase subunit GcvPA [Candidatus Melainabacteria bacterium]
MKTLDKAEEKVHVKKTADSEKNTESHKRPIPYLPHTSEDRRAMLDFLGISSVDELLKNIPKELKKCDLKLPVGKSELEVLEEFKGFAKKNLSLSDVISFCGGGVYNRYIPSVVDSIISKGEFYTAYTPYQPEASQGTLQAIYEFQTLICNLTSMHAANASLYDAATSSIEAALMSKRITGRNKILISKGINPEAISVCKTYAWGAGLKLELVDCKDGITDLAMLKKLLGEDTACYVTASPNFAGCLEPLDEISEIIHGKGAKLISLVDLISLAVLKPPGECGVDIVIGDGQATGNLPNYGGPHVGFIGCKKEYIRQLPGRIVGLTKDMKGNRAYTLTLQTREQHIRRERATSNICTNQSLNAIAVLVYLSYMGPSGLRRIAEISLNRAHYLAEKLVKAGCKLAFNSPFFNEFVLELPVNASDLISKLSVKNILPGLDLSHLDGYKSNQVLVCATEMNSTEQMDYFVETVNKILSK